MADLTSISKTNIDEISQALEDMDSLDMELFNDSFRKSKSSTNILKDSNVQQEEEIKRRVMFKDDSLMGLLSDEEGSLKEKKNLFATGSKSSLMEDLFNIKTPVASTTSIKSNNESESKLNLEQRDVNQLFSQKQSSYLTSKNNSLLVQNESPKEKNVQRSQNTFKNEEDVLARLLDKPDVVDNKEKKASLRQDLFGNYTRSSIFDTSINKKNKNIESEVSIQSAEPTNTTQKPKPQTINQPSENITTREFRRGRRNTKILNDPLGLLSTELLPDKNIELVTNENVPIRDSDTQKQKIEENLPEWLGGKKKIESKKLEEIKERTASKDTLSNSVEKITTTKDITESHDVNSPISGENNLEIYPENLSFLYNTQFNQQAAVMTMQQQEHELRTATVLSQQNEQLSKVSDTQHSILCNQEKQFNAFLKLQLERQVLLEKQIKMQQERINNYVRTLMAQPISVSSASSIYTSCKSEESEKEKDIINEKQEMENIIKELQMEKSKLENTVSTIKECHDNEMTYQAEFYKKEISFLKEALRRLEERARQDVEVLEGDYTAKVEKLRDEKLQTENQYKEEINNLKAEHTEHVEELYQLHTQNIKLLQKEYSNIIDSVFKAKHTEDQMIESMTSRKTDIEDVLQKANFIYETIKEHKEKIDVKDNEIMQYRENYLKVYEEDIKAQKLELKNQSNTLVEHRSKFIEMTEKFDTRLVQLVTELQNQNTQCTDAHNMLQKRAENLLRERELFEEKVKWERDSLQVLKESWMKEQERQIKLLAEEKKAIAVEKAQLEVLSKLETSSGDIVKAELEAAIKIAQDATARANREKLKWQEKMNELNDREQILQDNENLLISRAKELEILTQSALIKKEEGIKALRNAKQLENIHKEKLDQLQMQLHSLIKREKSVATEKYNNAKEKMISLTYESEQPERDIPHNFPIRTGNMPFFDVQSTSQISSELMNIVDPNLIMLKLNFEDQFESTHKPFRFPNLPL